MSIGYNNLASLYYIKGDHDRAENHYRRALEIAEKHLVAEDPHVAKILDNLAQLYIKRLDDDQAEPLYQRALAMTEKRLSRDSSNRQDQGRMASLHVVLGEMHRLRGATEQANEAWARAVALIEPLTENTETVWLRDIHVRALLHLGRIEEARPMAQKLLAKGWSHPGFRELCREHGFLPPGSDAPHSGLRG